MSTQVLHVIARMNVGGTARYVGELVEKIPDSFAVSYNNTGQKKHADGGG